MSVPLLSVCLVTYNQEFYIKKVLEGIIMQQTTFDYEIVIGEDCSEDATRRICEEYAIRYPNKIRLLPKQNRNVGLNYNFLRTFAACSGKYIAYLEGDDYWITFDKLQKQVDILEKNDEVVLVHTNCKVWNVKENTIKDRLIRFNGTCIRELHSGIQGIEAEFEGNFRHIKTSTCVYCKAVLEQIIKEDEFAYANEDFPTQDFQLFLDMSYRGKFAFIDEDTTIIGLSDTLSVNNDIDKNFRFKEGFFKIGLYYIQKYHLQHTVTQPWFQKEFHWFLNFMVQHSKYKKKVFRLLVSAKKEGYVLPSTQKYLLFMIAHPKVRRLLTPLYQHYCLQRES